MRHNNYKYKEKNFLLCHSYDEAPVNIDTHVHNCYELYYYISGDLTYYIEGHAYNLKKNDLIVTNMRELHRIIFNSTNEYERKFIQFNAQYIAPYQIANYDMLSFVNKRKLGYFNKIDAKDVISNNIDALWENIEKYSKSKTPESCILMKACFIEMIVKINNVFLKKQNSISVYPEYDNKVSQILEYINNNFSKKITLNLLENKFHFNKYYLCHLFKINTGFTVNEYVTYKRILKAQELLLSGETITYVANEVGFCDYATFYKAFKKIVGVSPKAYLKKHI